MRVIDMEAWPRKEHFLLFLGMEFPHVNLSIHADMTDLWTRRAQLGVSPTVFIVYVLAKAANRVAEFRQRIRGGDVVEHDLIHPLVTILGPDDLFGVCQLVYDSDFLAFAESATRCIEEAKKETSLAAFPHVQQREQPRDDLLSVTALPWLATTGFGITRGPKSDCIPLVAYGRVQAYQDRYVLPIHLNFHHGLIDGLHVAKFAGAFEEEARNLASQFGWEHKDS